MSDTFKFSLDKLPPSINDYLKFKVATRGGKSYAEKYESKESTEFKKYLQTKLAKEIELVEWDKAITANKFEHWYLELRFRTTRVDQDSHNYLKVLLDSLTGYLYEDDCNILPRIHRVWIDTKNPGFDFVLRKVKYVGLFDNKDDMNHFVENNKVTKKILKAAIEGRADENMTVGLK